MGNMGCLSQTRCITVVLLSTAVLVAAAKKDVSCKACTALARILEASAANLEPEPMHSDELVGDIRQRRRMMHTRSELDISRMLDGLCKQEKVVTKAQTKKACDRLLPEYRDELENHIFADGHKDLRFYLCGQLSRICGVHDLLDMAGEL